MAIDFVHDQDIDLAIFSLTGKFDLEEWLSAARAGAFPPAFIEIMDLRRCNLNAMRSMDLARFTRYLRSAMDRGRLIPGKTAILAIKDGPAAITRPIGCFTAFPFSPRKTSCRVTSNSLRP